jgi:hypothetical protein
MTIDLTQLTIALAGLVFSAVIIPLVSAAFKWLRGKTNNEALQSALTEAQSVADNVVASLQQTVVGGLKAKSSDGKLSADDAREIAELAAEKFLSDLSARSLAVIEDNTADIVSYVSNLIEARLFKLKTSS